MKILLVTEKSSQKDLERDGGARLVESLQRAFGNSLKIMQFGSEPDLSASWHFKYPFFSSDRFFRRILNARFIAEQVKAVEHQFTHIIFVHISMQFGLIHIPLNEKTEIWTFPMFLTPSYLASGEIVPQEYRELEKQTLARTKNILTPSFLEKHQLMKEYHVPNAKIHVVPRGVNRKFIKPCIRYLNGPPKICSIGSIKPQKNTLGLIRLFAKAAQKIPNITLRIIGAVQNLSYYSEVEQEIKRLNLSNAIEIAGYIPPSKLSEAIADVHLHLSASNCETFGRSIFETLASGIPNIARKSHNAAAEYLHRLPYAYFTDDDDSAIEAMEEMLKHLPKLSQLAVEIGPLYDDEMLVKILISKIYSENTLAISDFDGTLYHKNDPEKTIRCINAFKKFPTKILCSARSSSDLIQKLKTYDLQVDWIISYSGAMISDGAGNPLWQKSLDPKDIAWFKANIAEIKLIEIDGKILQIEIPAKLLTPSLEFRIEIYQETAFVAHWEASKLHAVHKLLRYMNWNGKIKVFGDGPYDRELINYFDGTLITPHPQNDSHKLEVEYG